MQRDPRAPSFHGSSHWSAHAHAAQRRRSAVALPRPTEHRRAPQRPPRGDPDRPPPAVRSPAWPAAKAHQRERWRRRGDQPALFSVLDASSADAAAKSARSRPCREGRPREARGPGDPASPRSRTRRPLPPGRRETIAATHPSTTLRPRSYPGPIPRSRRPATVKKAAKRGGVRALQAQLGLSPDGDFGPADREGPAPRGRRPTASRWTARPGRRRWPAMNIRACKVLKRDPARPRSARASLGEAKPKTRFASARRGRWGHRAAVRARPLGRRRLGAATEQRAQRWQRSKGLPPDGVAGPQPPAAPRHGQGPALKRKGAQRRRSRAAAEVEAGASIVGA